MGSFGKSLRDVANNVEASRHRLLFALMLLDLLRAQGFPQQGLSWCDLGWSSVLICSNILVGSGLKDMYQLLLL